MGILDDAIREHLDLKRRQGTSDTELKQLEDEAFGPPSRPGEPDFPERPPTGEAEALDAGPADDGLAPDEPTRMLTADEPPVAEHPADEPPAGEHPADEFGLGEPSPILDEPLAVDPAEDAPIEHLQTVEHHFEDAEPQLPVEDAPEPEPEPSDHAPATDEPAEPAAPEDEAAEGDVLEETPEFLQDRPEDDELWFEQKPPKDFDF